MQREAKRQEKNDDLRKTFAQHANSFHSWLTDTRTFLMEGSGILEDQLAATKTKASEIATKKESLRKIEELGVQVEEALIFDNK